MKKYQKAKMIAKNLPSGSYAAGCPENTYYKDAMKGWNPFKIPKYCKDCERAQ